jgi:WD40 repeat protein
VPYDAFISYSHAADGLLAPRLQEGLQRFAKPWWRRRALHVFRDDTGLSANPGLWSSITAALDESEYFVLLASPDAAQSTWVNREVEYWKTHNDPAKILPVVSGGAWVWDAAAGDFDPVLSTAVPAALVGVYAEEPRHIDMRWARDEAQLDLRNGRFRDHVADLAAPIHRMAKDDLAGADVRQHRRTVRTAWAAVIALVVLAVASGVAATAAASNAARAQRNQAAARRARDESDYQRIVAQSRDLKHGNRTRALLLAVEARHERDDTQSRGALLAALLDDPRFLGSIADDSSRLPENSVCTLGPSPIAVTGGRDGTIAFVDLAQRRHLGTPLALTDADGQARLAAAGGVAGVCSADGSVVLAVSADGRFWRIDPEAHAVSGEATDIGEPLNSVDVSPDDRLAAFGTTKGHVILVPLDGTSARRQLESGTDIVAAAFSTDGATLATSTRDQILLWDTDTWTERAAIADAPSDQSAGLIPLQETSRGLAFSGDGRWLVDSRRNIVRLYEAATGELRWARQTDAFGGVQVAFAPDGNSTFVQGTDGSIERDDSVTGRAVAPLMTSPDSSFASSFTVTQDGASLITTASTDARLGLWALDGRSAISTRIAVGGQPPLGFSPDGTSLLTAPRSNSSITTTGQVWDTTSGRLLGSFPTAAYPTLVDAHTVRGFFVDELAVDRLNLTTGEREGPRFSVPIDGVVQAATDGANILVGHTDGTVTRYQPDGEEVGHPWLTIPGGFAPTLIDIDGPAGIALIAYPNATEVHRLGDATIAYTLPADIAFASFSDDGTLLATSTVDNRVVIRDARTGQETGEPLPPSPGFDGVQLGGHGTIIVESRTGGQLYDLGSRQSVGDPFSTLDRPQMRPDGRELATTDPDGVILWDLDPDHWEQAACEIASRNLTRDEWATYFPNADMYHVTCPVWPTPR